MKNTTKTDQTAIAGSLLVYAVCPECQGDGKETCTNPDHGFIGALTFTEIGRLGCPCCGHDDNHKVPNGGKCEVCDGEGKVLMSVAEQYADENNLDVEIVPIK